MNVFSFGTLGGRFGEILTRNQMFSLQTHIRNSSGSPIMRRGKKSKIRTVSANVNIREDIELYKKISINTYLHSQSTYHNNKHVRNR